MTSSGVAPAENSRAPACRLISEIRSLPGVARTETMVVLSTHTERVQLALNPSEAEPAPAGKRPRRNGERTPNLRRA